MASHSSSSFCSEIKNGDKWIIKFEALEKKRREAQTERDILRQQVKDLYGNLKLAKDLLPTYVKKLQELQTKVNSLEEELESLKSSEDEVPNPNLQNGLKGGEIVE